MPWDWITILHLKTDGESAFMKKITLNPKIKYAVALEGGGAKGAYQLGMLKAFEDEGIRFCAFSGTSVGAVNAYFAVTGQIDEGIGLWRSISYSDVISGDEGVFENLFSGKLKKADIDYLKGYVRDCFKEKGIDSTPFEKKLDQFINEPAIKNSDMEFYAMTYSEDEKKELAIDMKKLPRGRAKNMLIASAYFPLFKHKPIEGVRYTDGSFGDTIPVKVLVDNGYTNILALRLYSPGKTVRVHIPEGTKVTLIGNRRRVKMGMILDFNPKRIKYELRMGYLDGLKCTKGYYGDYYCIKRTLTSYGAYMTLRRYFPHRCYAVNALVKAGRATYYECLVMILEAEAKKRKISRTRLYADVSLLMRILKN